MNQPQPQTDPDQNVPFRWLPKSWLQRVLDALQSQGYSVVGPRLDQGAIVYDEIQRVEELPKGWTDEQAPGLYRIHRRDDESLFGYNVGPHSWKKYLLPPLQTLMRSKKTSAGWDMTPVHDPIVPRALLGVRACELAAIAIQDRVFLTPETHDASYALRRSALFIVAVNCTQAASTCFCTSMGTGPTCTTGYDWSITELDEGFVVVLGSEAGKELADALGLPDAPPEAPRIASELQQRAADQITRRIDTEGIRDRLLSQLQHPHWDDIASRCLSCANCTMVCPTCFCSSVDEVTDLTDETVYRQRRWDSCFNVDFSHVAGGPIRDTVRSRYRQWLTHKLATWIDQFGTSGCVGCGRCITWCPVAIDLTQEVATLCAERVV